jgi:MFS transporter, DHA1 family, putative efflux transporter
MTRPESSPTRCTNRSRILLLALASFLMGTVQFVVVGILDQIAGDLKVSIATAGQLVTAFALAGAFGTPIAVLLTARWDRRRQLLLSLSLAVAGAAVAGTGGSFALLVASRVLSGLGVSLYFVAAYATVARLSAPGRQARSLANLAFGSSASLIVGVPLGRVAAAAYHWTVVFWAVAVLGLVALACVAWAIPSTREDAPAPIRRQLESLRRPRVIAALVVTLAMFVGFSAVNTFITPLMKGLVTADEAQIRLLLLGLGVSSLLGSKLGGLLADHWGSVRTLTAGMAGQMAALVAMAVLPTPGAAKIVLLLVWATAAWTAGPTLAFYLVGMAPEASAVLLSLNGSFVQLGFAAGAVLGGLVAAGASWTGLLWLGGLSVLAAGALVVASAPRGGLGGPGRA